MNYFLTIFLLTSLFVYNAFASSDVTFEQCIKNAAEMETAEQTKTEAVFCEEKLMFTAIGIQQKVSITVAGFEANCKSNVQTCADMLAEVQVELQASQESFDAVTSNDYIAAAPKWKINIGDSLTEIKAKTAKLQSLIDSKSQAHLPRLSKIN